MFADPNTPPASAAKQATAVPDAGNSLSTDAVAESNRDSASVGRRSGAALLVAGAIVLVTLVSYLRVPGFGFINLDDQHYIYRDVNLNAALAPGTLNWLLFSFSPDNWFPLTRLSMLLDYKLFGLSAGYYHAENLLLHCAAALLLLAFLRRATGVLWPSAFVAAVFALHPLHVESVAWVAERKDVLCAFFWFATLWAWVRYTERRSAVRYLDTLLLFSLGLMSKPMIVSLPFLLVLLALWPLRSTGGRRLLAETAPFFLLSGAVMAITVAAQRSAGAVVDTALVPLSLRLGNALVSVAAYLRDTLWPARLWFLYTYPRSVPAWQAIGAAAGILLLSLLVLRQREKRPYLAVGWFWFLVTLMPVIGLVQAGMQSRADRYMYVPMTGLAVMLAWGGAEAVDRWPGLRRWAMALAASACLAMAVRTSQQTKYWHDTDSLFTHSIEMDSRNDAALSAFARSLVDDPERLPDAIVFLRRALLIRPDRALLHGNLAFALRRADDYEGAIAENREALRLDPALTQARDNLGEALMKAGRRQEALEQYEQGVRANPRAASLHHHLGLWLLSDPDRAAEGLRHIETAVEIDPDDAAAHYSLGQALINVPGRLDDAVKHLQEVVRINPGSPEAHLALSMGLARLPGMELEAEDHRAESERLKENAARQCEQASPPVPGGCN